jgi:hypothetical protein
MQNKPNLLNVQMNVTIVLTKHYENKRLCKIEKKQSQTKPIYSERVESISKWGITSEHI